MAGNKSLNAAAKAKQDEFYTQLSDIAQELKHYSEHFAGKIVLCNCDDPFESNFFKYFALKFNSLKLKKLICTCFDGSTIIGKELNLFSDTYEVPSPERKAYKVELNEVYDVNGDGSVDIYDVEEYLKKNPPTLLTGNGDFRSQECIDLLKEVDIVVTNPPFSLFREYVGQLIQYDKKFLIIGSQNAITYKEIFPLIRNNKMWLGCKSGDMAFTVPDSYEPRTTRYWVDENGQKWRSMGNICWYTNLDHKKRHEVLDLYKTYNPQEYPKYDNYDAIEVSRVAEIPKDYEGYMGVPITFLDKYNPDQFEIYGASESEGKGFSNGLLNPQSSVTQPLRGGGKTIQTDLHQTQASQDCSITHKIQRSTERANMQELLFETSILGMIKNAEGKINGKITYARIIIKRKK